MFTQKYDREDNTWKIYREGGDLVAVILKEEHLECVTDPDIISDLKEYIKDLEERAAGLDIDLQHAIDERDEARDELSDLQKSYEELIETRDEAQLRVEELEDECEAYINQIDDLEEQIQDLRENIAENEEKLNQIQESFDEK